MLWGSSRLTSLVKGNSSSSFSFYTSDYFHLSLSISFSFSLPPLASTRRKKSKTCHALSAADWMLTNSHQIPFSAAAASISCAFGRPDILPCKSSGGGSIRGKSAQISRSVIGRRSVSRHQKMNVIGQLSVPGWGQLLHTATMLCLSPSIFLSFTLTHAQTQVSAGGSAHICGLSLRECDSLLQKSWRCWERAPNTSSLPVLLSVLNKVPAAEYFTKARHQPDKWLILFHPEPFPTRAGTDRDNSDPPVT